MKDNFIRTIYLYLFALVGLAVLVIGLARLVDLGLKAYVFKYADSNYDYQYERPVPLVFDKNVSKVEEIRACDEACSLTDSQIEDIDRWLVDYKSWQDGQKNTSKINYQRQSRERQASSAMSQIIVGLPLYLYHWVVIKRDRKKVG